MEEALLRRYPPAFPPDDEVVEDRPVTVQDIRGRHLATCSGYFDISYTLVAHKPDASDTLTKVAAS